MDKFYVLVVAVDDKDRFAGRSRMYKTYKEAVDAAKDHLENRNDKTQRYYVMEAVATVQPTKPPIEVIKIK